MLLLAAPVAAGLAGTVLPAFGILPALGRSMPSLQPFAELLAEPGLLRSVAIGVGAGLLSTAFALAAVFLFIAGSSGTRAFARLHLLLSPLLAAPHAAIAFGLAFLVAPSGFLARLVSPELTGWLQPPDWLIVNDRLGLTLALGLAVKETPFLFLMTLAALPQVPLPPARLLAASLGYGRIAGFTHTVWPALYRQIRLPVFAVIAFATSVVDVAAILGPTTPPTLAVRLVGWMNDPDLSMRLKASAGALLQLGISAGAILIWIGGEKLAGRLLRRARAGGRRLRHDRWVAMLGQVTMAAISGSAFLGLALLALWSVAGLWQFPDALPARLTPVGWSDALGRIGPPLARTILVASASALVAVLVAVSLLVREDETRHRIPGQAVFVLYLPLLVPQIAFLFGLQTALAVAGIAPGTVLLVVVHLVFVLPYVFLSLADPWRAFDPRIEAVARALGHGRGETLRRVKLPMLAPALATAAAVGFAVSVGLYLPTLIVGAGRLPTVTTEAVALASGGNRRLIGVWGVVQACLPAIAFAVAALAPRLVYRRRQAAAG